MSIHPTLIEVLFVHDGSTSTDEVEAALLDSPFHVRHVDSLACALDELAHDHVEVVLVDLAVRREGAFPETLRNTLGGGRLPLVALTEPGDAEPEISALGEGALEHLAKDELQAALLTRCLRYAMDRHRLERELERLAHGDPLTGLRNRRFWFKAFDAAFAAARRHGHPLSLMVADIDRFKQINDEYGHSVGDDVLQLVAAILRDGTRTEDTVARYGGDEFCVLLPHIDLEGARRAVTRLDDLLAHRPVHLPGGATLRASMTFGIAQLGAGHATPQDLFDAADQELYRGKRGR